MVCQGAIGREVEMARTSRSQWPALSRRTVVIRSLTACAAGAAAALAPVKEAAAKMAQKAVESPTIDQQLEFCWLLDGKFSGLCALVFLPITHQHQVKSDEIR